MKKYDNFYNCFSVLKSSERNIAQTNEIYIPALEEFGKKMNDKILEV